MYGSVRKTYKDGQLTSESYRNDGMMGYFSGFGGFGGFGGGGGTLGRLTAFNSLTGGAIGGLFAGGIAWIGEKFGAVNPGYQEARLKNAQMGAQADIAEAQRKVGKAGPGGTNNAVEAAKRSGQAEADGKPEWTLGGFFSGALGKLTGQGNSSPAQRSGTQLNGLTGEQQQTQALNTASLEDNAIGRFLKALMALLERDDTDKSNDNTQGMSFKLETNYKGSTDQKADATVKAIEELAGGKSVDGKITKEELDAARAAVKTKFNRDDIISGVGTDGSFTVNLPAGLTNPAELAKSAQTR